MRFLLFNNHCITDPTTGVSRSLWTIARWLVASGHDCRVLTTARTEAASFSLEDHLQSLPVEIEHTPPSKPKKRRDRSRPASRERSVSRFLLEGVEVTVLHTQHNDETRPNANESRQYIKLLDALAQQHAPDVAIACNGHPMIFDGLRRAQQHGCVTVFAVRGYGYFDQRNFKHVDHVFTCSQHVTDVYRQLAGIDSTPIEPPIDWSHVLAPRDSRAFVTFVNPSVHKGSMLFARLADMLGSQRSDIPIMVIQSGRSAGGLNAIPGIDFTRYPQIMAAPPVDQPADYLALTKILLVPSLWPEPFGRVAAEAMINGIPPIVSDRGALPQVVGGDYSEGGGGRVIHVPISIDPKSDRLPEPDEVQPWFDAVCEMWDDAKLYVARSERSEQLAKSRYDEAESRRVHVEYLTSLPGVSGTARTL